MWFLPSFFTHRLEAEACPTWRLLMLRRMSGFPGSCGAGGRLAPMTHQLTAELTFVSLGETGAAAHFRSLADCTYCWATLSRFVRALEQ